MEMVWSTVRFTKGATEDQYRLAMSVDFPPN
jgi:hypothetical protein